MLSETKDEVAYQEHIAALVAVHRQAACFRTNEKPYDVSGPPRHASFEEWWASFEKQRRGGKR